MVSCKKNDIYSDCIGCNVCEYTNYYLLDKISSKCYKNFYELKQYDTCYVKDFLLKIILEGNLIIESTYNSNPECKEKKYFINKLKKYEVEIYPSNLKILLKNNLIQGYELGYSPIEIIIDTTSTQFSDTIILLSGKFKLIDVNDNLFSTIIPETYIKF